MDPRLKALMLAILLLALPLAGFTGKQLLERETSPPAIGLAPRQAEAGMLYTFQVTTEGEGGKVEMPPDILLLDKDAVTTESSRSFTGNGCNFTALLPHTLETLTVKVTSDGATRTFPVQVTPAADPLLSGQEYYDQEVQLVDRYPGRVTGSDTFQSAMLDYRARFEALGLTTTIQKFTRSDETRSYEVWNLLGSKEGFQHPDEWIVVGAHLDIVDQTYQGAYDNGAGAMAVLELARALSHLRTHHTVVLALWGGEEQGLWGSEHFVDTLPVGVSVKAHLNFDMPGINWPGRDPFHGYVGPDDDDQRTEHPELLALLDRSAFELLGYPFEAFVSKEQEVGSSDHDSFMAKGIPSVFYFGMTFESWSTNYHTPTDTVQGMELHAGGHDALVGGFNTVAWVSFYSLVLLDNEAVT